MQCKQEQREKDGARYFTQSRHTKLIRTQRRAAHYKQFRCNTIQQRTVMTFALGGAQLIQLYCTNILRAKLTNRKYTRHKSTSKRYDAEV